MIYVCIVYLCLVILRHLWLEGHSCCLPERPPSVTLISPFNDSRYQPPNASLSPLGVSAWKRKINEKGMQGLTAGKGLISETVGRPGAVVIPGLCQSISDTASSLALPAGQLMSWWMGISCPNPIWYCPLTARQRAREKRLNRCSRALVSYTVRCQVNFIYSVLKLPS